MDLDRFPTQKYLNPHHFPNSNNYGFDVTSVPPVPISRGRTVIFDIVEYIIMEWTMQN
jgi:hypothetical protein